MRIIIKSWNCETRMHKFPHEDHVEYSHSYFDPLFSVPLYLLLIQHQIMNVGLRYIPCPAAWYVFPARYLLQANPKLCFQNHHPASICDYRANIMKTLSSGVFWDSVSKKSKLGTQVGQFWPKCVIVTPSSKSASSSPCRMMLCHKFSSSLYLILYFVFQVVQ